MNRKDFLKSFGFMTAGAAVSTGIGRINEVIASNLPQPKRKVIGIQLWSVRQLMNQDVRGTLKGLADCGYLAIEGVGYSNSMYFNTNINEFDKMVKDLGMKITSSHLNTRFTPETEKEALDWWKDTADKHKAIGCNTMIIPSLPSQRGVPREVEWLNPICEYINKVNEIARERGMRAGFHNHAADQVKMQNGKVVLDYLIEHTNPSFFIQLDNHNMVYSIDDNNRIVVNPAGYNPIEFLNKYKSRIKVLHVKDDDIIGASGNVNFQELFTTAAQYGIYEPIVEIEHYPVDVMECMCRSCTYLLAAPYVQYFG